MKKITLFLSLLLAIVSVQAQDYLIGFAGTGAGNTVGTVKVDNLTKGKSVSFNGTDFLHLLATVTGLNPEIDKSENNLRIYPNPMSDNTTLEFTSKATGIATIELFDISGKSVGKVKNILSVGTWSFKVYGLSNGIYTVKINSQAYSYTGKLISHSRTNTGLKIVNQGLVTPVKLKSAKAETVMQYSTGDRLKITGTSGNYSTVVMDVPTQSKTITFDFVACSDVDGNNYSTVKIGTQIWMGENLKTTKYRDGSQIPYVTENATWIGLTTGAYCWYNNQINNKNTYGALYNYFTVIDNRKIAPTGWHVPTDAEWTTLINYLGGESVAGGKLKETGTTHWMNPNVSATNETGFTANAGGYRGRVDGTFSYFSQNSLFWTSGVASNAMGRGLGNSYSAIYSESWYPTFGFSVRCVKDESTTSSLTITTSVISGITSTSAIGGGNISGIGGSEVTASGVCWSTTQNPTIANSKTTETSGVGSFTSNLTGLLPNTNYFVRAYATSSTGTVYGSEVTFKTLLSTSGSTVTDVDGNVYHTVAIGTQVWMVENLKATKYNDGTPIPNVTDNSAWGNLKTPGYCWFNNNSANKATYGALYNWYAVSTGKLCPTGWHIPTDAEWTTLINFLGGTSLAGGKLKETGTTHWKPPNTGANNTSGFTALPGGYRGLYGAFNDFGDYGNWWSATENSSYEAWYRNVYYDNSSAYRLYNYKVDGFSVRCIKD